MAEIIHVVQTHTVDIFLT